MGPADPTPAERCASVVPAERQLHRDRARADSFGQDAERYDRARPAYPPALVDELVSEGPVRVLDVGCGTGIAARLFLSRGCEVLGVEPDPRMAAVARGHGLTVEETAFEQWDRRGRQFDLVTSAQAWHWVEPARGSTKAADALRAGGRVGLFWNRGLPPDDVRSALEEVYRRTAPGLDEYSILLGGSQVSRFELAVDALEATGRFDDVTVSAYEHDRRYRTSEWVDLLPTHSDHHALEPDVLVPLLEGVGAAIDGIGGSFVMRYRTTLVSGRRADTP